MKKAQVLVILGAILFVLVTTIHFKPNKKDKLLRNDFLITAEHSGAQMIESLRSVITPLINAIIQQELNLSLSEQAPVFKTPPHHNLTLYYIFNWLAELVFKYISFL